MSGSEGAAQTVVFDRTGKANGRGAYVCAVKDCIEKAVKQRRFERSLNVNSIPDGLLTELLAAVPVEDTAQRIGSTTNRSETVMN
jgi:predicted RNA-binding protein YlxR (DUF448 family)